MRDITEIKRFMSAYQQRQRRNELNPPESALFNKIIREELAPTSDASLKTNVVTPEAEESNLVELFLKQYPSKTALIEHFLELDTWAEEELKRGVAQHVDLSWAKMAIVKFFENPHNPLLDLSRCNLHSLPKCIAKFSELDELILQCKIMPQGVEELKKLKTLEIKHTPLGEFPEFLRGFTQLQNLSLNGCELKFIPEWIEELKDLIHLEFAENRLTDLPQSIGNLKHLETLDLNDNALERLPESLLKLKSLRSLSIDRNKLCSLPVSIRDFSSHGEYLSCHNNPLTIGVNQLGEEVVPLWEQFPLDKDSPEFEKYIVKKKGFAKTFRYDSNQKRYGNLMHQAVQMGEFLINQRWEFSDLLRFFSDRRCTMALLAGDEEAVRFGTLRTSPFVSPCLCPPYNAIPLRLQEWRSQGNRSPHYKVQWQQGLEEIKGELGADLFGFNYTSDYQVDKYLGDIEGEEVPLSRLLMDTELPRGERIYREQIIVHTNPEHLSKIMSYVEKLYKEALELEGEKLMDKLGEIFWWICQAKPWERGDPSIAEMLIKSVFNFKGYQVPAWKEGVIPWVEVMCCPDLKEFLKHFPTLFDGEVHLVDEAQAR